MEHASYRQFVLLIEQVREELRPDAAAAEHLRLDERAVPWYNARAFAPACRTTAGGSSRMKRPRTFPQDDMTSLKTLAALLATLFCLLPAAQAQAISSGFVAPAAPTEATRPSTGLPNLGRDKHKMPFYHPKQTVRAVRTTAYTHTEGDHLAYGPRSASGSRLNYSDTHRSAAADWSVYPLGTQFKIKGQPYIYTVDDYGSALVGTATIDIYQPTKALMRSWGTRVVEIEVIKWGSSRESMEKLAQRRGYRHCNNMYANLEKMQQRKKR